jgi:cyclase
LLCSEFFQSPLNGHSPWIDRTFLVHTLLSKRPFHTDLRCLDWISWRVFNNSRAGLNRHYGWRMLSGKRRGSNRKFWMEITIRGGSHIMKAQSSGEAQLTRREAFGRVAWAGLGITSALIGGGGLSSLSAQAGLPAASPPSPDGKFPNVPSWKTELRQLAPNVYAYVQAGGPGIPSPGVSNAGCIVGDDHWMAIDALQAPIPANAFIAAANKVSGKRCGRLVNTHHHGDHVGGNQFFLPAEIVGHPYCRQEVLKTVGTTARMWEKHEGLADGTEERKVVPPTTTFEDKVTYYYGDTVVEFRFVGPAHTWGDVMAYLPQHKILFAGDVAFFYVAPYAHNANVPKWLEAVDKIMAMDVETIVAGHGPIGGKKELAAMAEYFRLLRSEARKRFEAGMSAGQAAAEIRLGKFDNWLGPERIVMNTVRLYNEFKGTAVPDMDVEGTRRAIEEYNAIKSSGARHA